MVKFIKLAIVKKSEKIYRADHEHHITTLGLRGGVEKIKEEKSQLNFDDLGEILYNSNNRLILLMGGSGKCLWYNDYTVATDG